MKWYSIGCAIFLGGCGDNGGGGPDADMVMSTTSSTGSTASTEGSGTSTTGSAAELPPLHECGEAELIVEQESVHDLATDSDNYYWLGLTEIGEIAVYALSKSGGDVRVVTSFPTYFDYLLGATDLEVAQDATLLMDDTSADDDDEYVYFSGDTKIWRVKKDGTGQAERVSTDELNELGPATCNFARIQLTPDALFVCRKGQIFRMDRGTDATPEVIYAAPEGGRVEGFAVNGSELYTNGPFDDSRHFAPILQVSVPDGLSSEFGEMLEGLVPDAFFVVKDTLLFSSLVVLEGPDLETTSEWASRQGTYRLPLNEQVPSRFSDSNIILVNGASADASAVYAVTGRKIVRFSPEGSTRVFVDCTDDPDLHFDELVVDEDGVYIRDSDKFYRFAKE